MQASKRISIYYLLFTIYYLLFTIYYLLATMGLKLILDRFENDKAVLKTEKGDQTIIWLKNLLPENIKEGAIFNFDIKTLEEAEAQKRKQAKDLLNEILNIEE